MKKQEIIEGNKLIAEFMGLRQIPINLYGNEKCYYFYFPSSDNYELTQEEIQKESFDILNYAWSIYNLSYHLSWDWLMPVVEKIEKIHNDHHGYFGVYISSNQCIIQGTKLNLALKNPEYGFVYLSDTNAIFDTKIKSTWFAVVEFIKWYTLNIKNNKK